MITDKVVGVKLPEVYSTMKTKVTHSPIEKQKPQIQERQVDNNRPKLGRDRAGMQCKQPQPVTHTLVSTNKSPNIPSNQNVTKDSMKYPVPNQLITHRTKTLTMRQVQDKNREYPCQPDLYFRPPPRLTDNLPLQSPKTKAANETNIDIKFEETHFIKRE